MITDADRVPLGSRAWISDGRGGALVTADGTVDWYCPGRLDAPATLARLLDARAGAVRVGLVRDGTGTRRRLPPGRQRYLPGTMIAETDMTGGGGQLRVTDLMPWPGAGSTPPGRIVRIATALAGPLDVEIEVIPGSAWGPARRVSTWSDGLVADGAVVRCGLPLVADPLDRDHPRWRGSTRLQAGQSVVVTIDDATDDHHLPLSVDAARDLAERTALAWRSWLAALVYDGAYTGPVARAALTVRSLTGPSGAPARSATTSLPRRPGSERNRDDRSVSWADAAQAAGVLASVGLDEDAEAAERWLREAAETTPLPWPQALALDGAPLPPEEELGLAGWRRAQPVVVGADPEVRDLDLYGDVVAAVSASRRGPTGGGGPGPLVGAWPALVAAADWLTDHWGTPDGGVWASRGRPARLVASATRAWVALDGMRRLAQAANPLDLAAIPWHDQARQIRRWIEAEGLAADGGLRRDPSPADHPDAALLRVAWQGPWPTGHPIVARTVERVLERLGSGLLLYRQPDEVDDGRAGPDSPDLLASLWGARALASLGRWEEAHERFEAVVALGAPLGLLGEAADPLSGELLGNLPSAPVHLAVIATAVALGDGPS